MSGASRFQFYMDCFVDDGLLLDHKWHEVTGGGLPFPLLIRVGRTGDGRPTVDGMIIGSREGVEVTPDALRSIRVGAILAQLFEDFDPDAPPGLRADLSDQVEWGLMDQAVWRPAQVLDGRGGRGPDDDELREFARIYQREKVRNPRRFIAATAKALNISPATAHRRVKMCQARGYLPSD